MATDTQQALPVSDSLRRLWAACKATDLTRQGFCCDCKQELVDEQDASSEFEDSALTYSCRLEGATGAELTRLLVSPVEQGGGGREHS